MFKLITILEDTSDKIRLKILPTRVRSRNSRIYLTSKNNLFIELSIFDAVTWLEIADGISVKALYQKVKVYRNIVNEENLFDKVAKTLKKFYTNGFITLFYCDEKLKILSWQKYAINQCHFALTYNCNLKCKHCLIAKQSSKEFKTNEILNNIEQLREKGCESIIYSGGEITIRKDLTKILKYTIECGIKYGFNTNATIIDDKIISFLLQYKPEHIGISLYSHTPEVHDQIVQKKGSFRKTLLNIRILAGYQIPVTIKTILMKDNFDHRDKIREFASNLNLPIRFDPHILPKQNGSKQPLKYLLDAKSLNLYYSRNNLTPNKIWDKQNEYVCSAGLDRCAIDPFGNVSPCAIFPYKIGNLKKKSLKRILADWRKLAKTFLPTASQLSDCFDCNIKKYCRPCPGLSYIEEGKSIKKSKWICMATSNKIKIERQIESVI